MSGKLTATLIGQGYADPPTKLLIDEKYSSGGP